MAVSIEGDHFFPEGRGQFFKALDSNGQTAFRKSVTCFYSHQQYGALFVPPTQWKEHGDVCSVLIFFFPQKDLCKTIKSEQIITFLNKNK